MKNSVNDFLERVRVRLESMTPEECLELHKEARKMSEPIYFLPDGAPVDGNLSDGAFRQRDK